MSDQSLTPDTDILSRATPAAPTAHSMENLDIARRHRGKESSTEGQQQNKQPRRTHTNRGEYCRYFWSELTNHWKCNSCSSSSSSFFLMSRVENGRNAISSSFPPGEIWFSLPCVCIEPRSAPHVSMQGISMNSRMTRLGLLCWVTVCLASWLVATDFIFQRVKTFVGQTRHHRLEAFQWNLGWHIFFFFFCICQSNFLCSTSSIITRVLRVSKDFVVVVVFNSVKNPSTFSLVWLATTSYSSCLFLSATVSTPQNVAVLTAVLGTFLLLLLLLSFYRFIFNNIVGAGGWKQKIIFQNLPSPVRGIDR